MLNFADWENSAAAAGLNDFSIGTLCNEKEQSTDSTGTDVTRDFNGRAGERIGLVAASARPAALRVACSAR
jgi:hypothetical protein